MSVREAMAKINGGQWKKQMDDIAADLQEQNANFLQGWAMAVKGLSEEECRIQFPGQWDRGVSAGYMAKRKSLESKANDATAT